MPFWTTQRIRDVLQGDAPPILKPKLECVTNACYEMALGSEAFITSSSGQTKEVFKAGQQVRIPPGQFGLLITEEELRIPLNVLAFISIKASKKMGGLINVSGFHVDPGFHGRLKFSVYNAGSEPIVLEVGAPLFPIWFYELPEDNEDHYSGKHQGQVSISASDVERLQGVVYSPAALQRQIDELRSTVSNWKAATIGVIGTAILTAVGTIVATLLR